MTRERLYRWNFMALVLDSGGYAFAISFLSHVTIVPYYLSLLTESSLLISLAPALFVLGANLPALATSNLVRAMARRKGYIVALALAERAAMALLVLFAWVAVGRPGLGLAGFLVAYALLALTMGSISPAYVDFQARAIFKRRGFFFGMNQFVGAILGALGGLVVKRLLAAAPGPEGFLQLFGVGLLVSMVTIWFTVALKEPGEAQVSPRLPWPEHFRALRQTLSRAPAFSRFLAVRTVLNMAEMATPFLSVYATQRFNLSASSVGLFAVSFVVGQSLTTLLWGWMGERWGYKSVLLTAAGCGVLALLVALAGTGPTLLPVVFALGGAVFSGNMIGNVNLVIEYSPPGETPLYVGLLNGLMAPSLAAPLLAGLLLKAISYQQLFVTSLCFYVAGLAWLAFVPDPRERPTMTPALDHQVK